MTKTQYAIVTLGSHSALQILRGAKDEGFKTLVVTLRNREEFYKRFKFIDQIETIDSFAEFPQLEKKLIKQKTILIPHGSFVAYLGIEKNKTMKVDYFGNKKVLDWEEDRNKQTQWLKTADIRMPEQYKSIKGAKFPVIVKSFGAAGGTGYFLAKNSRDFNQKVKSIGKKKYVIQRYITGATLYIHYFYSPITEKLEIMSMDRRYETNADGLGRIPAWIQQEVEIQPSYVVIGNSNLVLRESMLPEAYEMRERIVAASKKLINQRGIFGPFCLETIITPEMKFYAIEISARIVAGTNLFTHGSAYSWLNYDEPMSTGRRIAREIKMAIKKNKLKEILD